MISESALRFVRGTIKSVWALELLLLMKRRSETIWTVEALTAELRGSVGLVNDLVAAFEHAGLIERASGNAVRYRPQRPEFHDLVCELERVHAERPLTLIKEIVSQPNDKIQSFAEAFRLKKE